MTGLVGISARVLFDLAGDFLLQAAFFRPAPEYGSPTPSNSKLFSGSPQGLQKFPRCLAFNI